MGLDQWVRRLMPRDDRFRALLVRLTANVVAAARALQALTLRDSLDERRIVAVELKRLEHDGDRITREVFEALNSTFVTPLDREDLRALASDLDEVIDAIDAVGRRLVLFELAEGPTALVRFAEILVRLAAEIESASSLAFDGARALPAVEQAIVRISDLENEADDLYGTVVQSLFREITSPVELLKWKEIYEGLEAACDRCKDYANVLAGVVTKSA